LAACGWVPGVGVAVGSGGLLAGRLVAESGQAGRIEPLVHPVRDIFAAVFFVSVGMLIEPRAIVTHGAAIVVLTVLVVVGKVASVAFGAFMTGKGPHTSIAAGMSLAQIGEFSFIIAGLGLSLGVIGEHVYPVAVTVSAITTLLTPWLVRRAASVASRGRGHGRATRGARASRGPPGWGGGGRRGGPGWGKRGGRRVAGSAAVTGAGHCQPLHVIAPYSSIRSGTGTSVWPLLRSSRYQSACADGRNT